MNKTADERIAQLEAEVERLTSAIRDYEDVLAAVSYGDMDLKEAILNEMSSRPSFKLKGGGRESGDDSNTETMGMTPEQIALLDAAEPASICPECQHPPHGDSLCEADGCECWPWNVARKGARP